MGFVKDWTNIESLLTIGPHFNSNMTSLFQLDEELLTCCVDCFGYTNYECPCSILEQETKLVAVQSGLKRMAAEAASKEKNLRFREHAVIHSEKDLQVIILPL